ncbi:hypothetical protein PROFUN_14745 [Planoprotostelium fungivorum]|uniref:Uncharacterized protein n=1 Tax=Planoprotostelium fungivorum TaxID=1890364 RepID=A0A2P6MXY2_9EUKA|nr:hypothetical protein PROFUN_14745 [Planoprotostelium fungivorum]
MQLLFASFSEHANAYKCFAEDYQTEHRRRAFSVSIPDGYSEAPKRLYEIAENNWVNKEEKTKQRHKMGYLLGLSGIGKSTMLSVIKEQLIIAVSQDQKYAYDSSFLNSLKNAVEVYIDLSNGSGPNGDDMSIVFASRLFVSLSEGSSWGRRRTPIPASKFTPRVVWELLGKAIQATGRDGYVPSLFQNLRNSVVFLPQHIYYVFQHSWYCAIHTTFHPYVIVKVLSEGSSWGRRRTAIPASKFTPRVVWELLGKAIQATGRDGWTAVIIAVDESQWVTDSVRSLNSFAGSIFSLMTSDEVEVGRLGQSIAVQHKTYIIPSPIEALGTPQRE